MRISERHELWKRRSKDRPPGLRAVLSAWLCIVIVILVATTHARPQINDSQVAGNEIVVDIGSLKYIFAPDIKSFVAQLNAAGKNGYKLEQLTKLPLGNSESFEKMKLAAIVKLESGNRYEYDWFEAFTPGEVVARINLRSAQGFYFRDAVPVLQGICEDNTEYQPDDGTDTQRVLDEIKSVLKFSYGAIYFLERKNNEVKPNDYRVAIGMVRLFKKTGDDLEKELNDLGMAGFAPVSMNSFKILNKYAFAVLAKKRKSVSANNDARRIRSEFKLIVSESGFEKKVNVLAKEGYSLLFSGRFGALNYALMVPPVSPNISTSYKFLTSTDKAFSSDLSTAAARNLIYSGIGSHDYGCDSVEAGMVFQTSSSDQQRQPEYETLMITALPKKSKERSLTTNFQRPADVTVGRFQSLLRNGYVVRDLYFDNGIKILFEKR
jgi:hypothetical protein